MSQSLYTAMGGIAAATTQLSVISNNVANINTTAFKSSSVEFSDVYSSTLSYGSVATTNAGGTNPIQVGVGTQVSAVSTDFNTGSWMSTGNDTDLMINGSGFFAVQSPDQASTYYTRAGDFSVDAKGNLVTAEGFKVLGTNSILASATSGTTVQVPISITADVKGNVNIATQSMTNLNNLGNNTTVTSGYFTITNAAGTTYNMIMDSADVSGNVGTLVAKLNADLGTTFSSPGVISAAPSGVVASCADGKIIFTSVNKTTPFATNTDAITFATPSTSYTTGGTTYQPSNFLLVTSVASASTPTTGVYDSKELDLTVSISDLTSASKATASNSTTINKDGTLEVTYKDGSTLSVELGTDGATYQFVYTTPKATAIKGDNCSVSASVATPANLVIQMATVTNTEGLLAAGNNLYSAGPNTGDIVYTTAGQMGCGQIQSGGLEASNVDLSKELSNMILAQRSIQANSRVFTTTSDIMQTITQMGR